jgi:hypothetical protein
MNIFTHTHTEERGGETVLMCRSGRWNGKSNDDSTDKE